MVSVNSFEIEGTDILVPIYSWVAHPEAAQLERDEIEAALEETARAKQKAAGMFAHLTAAELALQNKLSAIKANKKRRVETSSGLQEVPKARLPLPRPPAQ